MDEQDDRSRFMSALDTADNIATAIGLAMCAVVAVAVIAVLGYLYLNPPKSFQTEFFYIGIAIVLVVFWLIGQVTFFLNRRRRRSSDGWALPKPQIQMKPSGFSLEWGSMPSAARQALGDKAFTWNFESGPIQTTTFKVDAAQLDAARAARAAGRSWEEIAKQVNPDYGQLSTFDQSLYQRALQLAVDESTGRSGRSGD